MERMHLRWLRAIALLPACAPAAPPPTNAPSAAPMAASATVASSAAPSSSAPAEGCFCLRHKSDGPHVHGRPLCAVGEKDFAGEVCTAGNPAEGPLPPPDLADAPAQVA